MHDVGLDGLIDRMRPIDSGVSVLRDEGTRRTWQVALAPFAIDPVPVTRGLVAALDGRADASPALPLVEVSWNDAIRLCNRLSARFGLRPCYVHGDDREAGDVVWERAADGFRLPAEAEWELACRAGSRGQVYGPLDDIAWYRANAGERLRDVAGKQPNAWGLYDMLGNVWEWCFDPYDPPEGPRVYGPYRVFRGGGWLDAPRGCRASCRRKSHPTFRIDDLGFRLARTVTAA